MAPGQSCVNGNKMSKRTPRKKLRLLIALTTSQCSCSWFGQQTYNNRYVVIPDITTLYFAALAKGIDDIAEMYAITSFSLIAMKMMKRSSRSKHTSFKTVDGVIYGLPFLTEKTICSEFSRSRTCRSLREHGCYHQLPSVNID